ncbi:MAG: macro domain-containing protein [Lachnospiraceae bacterium]|nr:macro domain-containing protein [Lachnospiraceae bacterium]
MPLRIIRNDITKVKADAIVNTANPKPCYASGTDLAIYEAAGADKLLADRVKIGNIARGEVAVTPAYKLKAKYILHTVGPAWDGGNIGEFDVLKSCYRNSLEKARELGCGSIAFPLIATGVYGFPKDEALRIALDEIGRFLMREDVDMTVKLVVFDEKTFRLSKNLFFEVESFISDEEVRSAYMEEYLISGRELERERFGNRPEKKRKFHAPATTGKHPFDEDHFDKTEYISDATESLSFQNHLLKLIMEKDIDNATVYKSSNVTKGAFSKILCGDTKKPQKKTVLGFCIGLKLDMEEAEALLASADMAFNPYNKRDRLVIQCIRHGQYDIRKVNAMLFVCDQPLLGN